MVSSLGSKFDKCSNSFGGSTQIRGAANPSCGAMSWGSFRLMLGTRNPTGDVEPIVPRKFRASNETTIIQPNAVGQGVLRRDSFAHKSTLDHARQFAGWFWDDLKRN